MAAAYSTHVEAFWSNSDQKGVTRKNSTRMRSTL
jgi:hypothetical protein